jgi:predicted transcriptional regulator
MLVMQKDELIKLAGSQSALARLLGISQAAVSRWKHVPQQRIWQVKLLKPDWFDKV